MNITIITGPFASIPPYSISAIEKLWFNCGQVFSQMGHTVHYIAKRPEGDVSDSEGITYVKGYDRSGNPFKDKILREFIYAVRALNAVREGCDVLVLNSIFAPILCALYHRRYKVAVYNVARMPKRQMSLYRVDMLSCVSSAVRNELLQQSPRLAERSCVVSNPVDTSCFYFHERTCSKTPSIVYSGRVHPEKGLDILVRSIDMLNRRGGTQVGLSLVGPCGIGQGGGGKEYTDRLDALATTFRINYVHAIKEPELLANELMKHDIFCYPSVAEKGETFGVAPLEAMALGIPTVVSSLACFTDFATDEKNALIFDHRTEQRVEELADKFHRLIDDSSLYNRIARCGAETAINFSNEKIAQKYIDLFEQLLARHRGPCRTCS